MEKDNFDTRSTHSINRAICDSGLGTTKKLTYLSCDGMVIICPTEMTAMDVLRCLHSTERFVSELLTALGNTCDVCKDCGDCNDRDGDSFEKVTVNPHLLRQAGIPATARLCAEVDRDEGAITISASAAINDLSDISPRVRDILIEADICFNGLEEHLAEGDVICGLE